MKLTSFQWTTLEKQINQKVTADKEVEDGEFVAAEIKISKTSGRETPYLLLYFSCSLFNRNKQPLVSQNRELLEQFNETTLFPYKATAERR